ncbi:alpha/beta hydrolase [Taibaiella lutea]|uniref:Alpha/beta hydrolase n=1 Tax=Taibaiella lutea TaxID=2608001 RepID=A0A5M6CP54_9BACT|nr:alpha/beta hydrolase [Taibaiella lutea]KAA5534929.1 alpha/beta hydrolase [Taibaiella lutea]
MKNRLLEYIVRSTQQILNLSITDCEPIGCGNGCLIVYQDRQFLISVQHVTELKNSQSAINLYTEMGGVSKFYFPGAFNYVDMYSLELETENPELKKLESLDIGYLELGEYLDINQPQVVFKELTISGGKKTPVPTNLSYDLKKCENYFLYGRVVNIDRDREILHYEERLEQNIKYDGKFGPYERFVIDRPITQDSEFKGMSGAPIFSETGEPVAFLTNGFLDENYIYAFSAKEIKRYLDIHIDKIGRTEHLDLVFDEPNKLNEDWEDFSTEWDLNDQNLANENDFRKINFNKHTGLGDSTRKRFVEYAVYYSTNRRLKSESPVLFDNKRGERLHLGHCAVSIPYNHKVGTIDGLAPLIKNFFIADPNKDMIILSNDLFDSNVFIQKISEKIRVNNDKDILLFVHGFKDSFEDGILRAAQLGYDLNYKGPVISYSWPTMGSFFGYVADSDSAEISSNYLNEFLTYLIDNIGENRINIIAHSMGSVVLSKALLKLKKQNLFPSAINQIILAAPDIDRDLFINHIMPEIQSPQHLTLYVSKNDWAMKLSRFIRHSYNRLGEAGEEMAIIEGVDTIDASGVETDLIGHSYFSQKESLINDIHMTFLGHKPPQRRLDQKQLVIRNEHKIYWTFKKI